MATGDIETFFEDGVWKNRTQGSASAENRHTDKCAALAVAREMACQRKVEHVIKNKDGTIADAKDNGNDLWRIPDEVMNDEQHS
jgi:hypothetical protein